MLYYTKNIFTRDYVIGTLAAQAGMALATLLSSTILATVSYVALAEYSPSTITTIGLATTTVVVE